jgi:hypothetical protein
MLGQADVLERGHPFENIASTPAFPHMPRSIRGSS